MAIDYVSIGLRIKNARRKKGITQEQLAQVIGSGREHIVHIEGGERGVSLDMLVNIANTLDVPITELLTDSLTTRIESNNSELHRLILDCTAQEEKIITRTAQALKAILIEHGV